MEGAIPAPKQSGRLSLPVSLAGIHFRVAEDAHLAPNPNSEFLAGTRAASHAT